MVPNSPARPAYQHGPIAFLRRQPRPDAIEARARQRSAVVFPEKISEDGDGLRARAVIPSDERLRPDPGKGVPIGCDGSLPAPALRFTGGVRSQEGWHDAP